MNEPNLNLEELFAEVEQASQVEYRDPFQPPYSDPAKTTRSQRKAEKLLKQRTGQHKIIAMIGAKGSGKTHFGSGFAFHQGQTFPESLGCVISNTYTQAKDNAGALFRKMSTRLGIPVRFFTSKTVKGRPMTSLFIADLDGTGFGEGKNFYMLVRSFDAVSKLEGIELDWLWCEEIQDAQKDAFITVYTRVRGQNADRSVFIAGMPFDEHHWMYKYLPKIGATEEEQFDEDPDACKGIFLEPTIFENQHNLPEGEIERMKQALGAELAERWIYGRRTSLTTNKILHQYRDHVHRKGRMSQILAHYDPNLPLILSIDFNTSPMCATVWQVKRWNDKWADDEAYDWDLSTGMITDKKTGETFNDWYDVARPNREVLAQVDEFEVWKGGTQGLMDEFVSKYYASEDIILDGEVEAYQHTAGVTVVGDATGNRDDTRSQTTDWKIISETLLPVPNVTVIRGLVQNSNLKTGEVKYSNPPRRDTINNLNAGLMNANMETRLCFLSSSPLESDSGGAAASCAMMTKTPDGRVDDSVDKAPATEKDQPRTHFFDTVRYVFWFYTGGMQLSSASYHDMVKDVADSMEVDLSVSEFYEPTFGSDWDIMF